MDGNDYFLEVLVRDRLAEARAEAARHALAAEVRPPRRPAWAALAQVLVGLVAILRTRW